MVCNSRPGDKWVPGTILECTGPLSYLVQVSGGQTWKRHIDHFRQMTDSPHEVPRQYPRRNRVAPDRLRY